MNDMDQTKTAANEGSLHSVVRVPGITLTIKQPWASLIVNANKDIENRTWFTKYRGPILIHASKKKDYEEAASWRDLRYARQIQVQWKHGSALTWGVLPSGGIIGMAEIVDCVTESDSPYFCGPYGFVLRNARPLPFFECRGQLGFWHCNYPEALLREPNVRSKAPDPKP